MAIAQKITYYLQNERFIHSIKTSLACFIGFVVAGYAHFRTDQWLIITTLVVMCGQINVGSMIQKSYMRFLGTMAGAAISILTLYFFGANYTISMIVVVLSAILFSFIATSKKSYNDSGTLGAVTVAIILIGNNPTIVSGFERCAEILVGILIAAVVSQLIFPVHAKNHLRNNQAMTIRKLRTFYTLIFSDHLSLGAVSELRELDEDIAKSLIAQRKLASEAKQEHFGTSFDLDRFQQSLWFEKEILRSIIFMYHAYHASEESKKVCCDIPQIHDFHQGISAALDKIAACIENQRIDTILIPNIEPLKIAVEEKIQNLSLDVKMNLNAFLFGAGILVSRLGTLAALVHIV